MHREDKQMKESSGPRFHSEALKKTLSFTIEKKKIVEGARDSITKSSWSECGPAHLCHCSGPEWWFHENCQSGINLRRPIWFLHDDLLQGVGSSAHVIVLILGMLCPAGSWLGDSFSPLSQRYLSTCPVAHGVTGDSRGEVQDKDLSPCLQPGCGMRLVR